MCILQLAIVGCYVVTTGIEYCCRMCLPKKFRLIDGKKLWDTRGYSKHEECAICFESMCEDDVLIHINRCRHVFHFSCMKEWNNNYNQTCPSCRGAVGVIM